MPIFLRIVGGGGCCPCNEQSGCDCSAVPCGRQCRSKAGLAELCGFEEFVDPSLPPKKYRQRRMTGGMTIQRHGSSATCDSHCPGAIVIDYTGTITDLTNTFHLQGILTLLGIVGAFANYQVSGGSATKDGVPVDWRFSISGVGAVGNGYTFSRPLGTLFAIVVEVNQLYWHGATPGPDDDPYTFGSYSCIEAGRSPTMVDTWNYQGIYDKDTCELSETDGSQRQIGGAAPTAIPCDSPGACYGSGADVDESPAERLVTGKGCVADGSGGSDETAGTAYDILELEDTEEDAMTRAMGGLEWAMEPCDDALAFRSERGAGEFSFGFKFAQVKFIIGSTIKPITIGHTYKITGRFGARILGSGGPFLPLSIFEIILVADTIPGEGGGVNPEGTDSTDWIDIPNLAGYQVKATGCTVEDIML